MVCVVWVSGVWVGAREFRRERGSGLSQTGHVRECATLGGGACGVRGVSGASVQSSVQLSGLF